MRGPSRWARGRRRVCASLLNADPHKADREESLRGELMDNKMIQRWAGACAVALGVTTFGSAALAQAPAQGAGQPATPPTVVTETTEVEIVETNQHSTDMGMGETDAFGDLVEDEDAALPEEPEEVSSVRYFIGARYRAIIVPKFVLNIFGEGGKNLFFPAAGGLELSIHSPKMEYDIALWYAGYGFDDMLFKGNNEPEKAWEFIDSSLKTIYGTVDFLWLADMAPDLHLTYGFSLGLGVVFGNLIRTQAYPVPPGSQNYRKCPGVIPSPQPGSDFCKDGEHYGYNEPNWFDNGSKPVVFPWIAVQTGLRYQIGDVAMRLDLGFGTSAFFMGLAADIGL